jgi:tetratricopeptide (TPR) repeat protein
MRNHIVAFAIAVGVLIISVSLWIVFSSQQTVPDSTVTATDSSTTPAWDFNTVVDTAPASDTAETVPADPFIATETTTPVSTDTEPVAAQPAAAPLAGFAETLQQGDAALATGDYAAAVAAFTDAARLDETSLEALLGLAEAQFNLQEYEKMRANLQAIDLLDATHPQLFILRGRLALKENKFLEADGAFAKAGADGAYWQGITASFYDRANEAQKILKQAAADPKYADEANNLLAAYDEYALFPDSPKTHIDTLLAKSFNQLGQYELAIGKINPVLRDQPDYRDAWILLGYAHFALADYPASEQDFLTAYGLDPSKAETQYFLGLTYFNQKNWPDAEKYLLLAKKNKFPQVAELDSKLADTFYEQGKYREAADLYTLGIEKSAAAIDEFVRPIDLYLRKAGDGNAAWHVAQLALERHPDEAQSYNLAGWVSLTNGYLPEAKSYFDKAISLDSKLPGPYLNLGKYYERLGQIEDARANYKQAYDLDPEGPLGAAAAESYNRLLKTDL